MALTMAGVTAAYRSALSGMRSGNYAAIQQLTASVYDPARPLSSLTTLGGLVGARTVRAQGAAVGLARSYLGRFVAAGTGLPLGAIGGPFAAPRGVVGLAANGRPVTTLAAFAPGLFVKYGDPGPAVNWLTRLATSEPYRAANETVRHAAMYDERLYARFTRETSAGSCAFCVLIADRGYTEAAADFKTHANCRCTAGPMIDREAAFGLGRFGHHDWDLSDGDVTEAQSAFDVATAGIDPGWLRAFKGFAGVDPRTAAPSATSDPGKTMLAYYDTGPTSDRRIHLRRELFDPRWTGSMQAQTDSGWFAKDGDAAGYARLVAHETGHYLFSQLDSRAQGRVLDTLGQQGDLAKTLSAYGAKTPGEAVAEAWAERIYNPSPRPAARAISGAMMRELSAKPPSGLRRFFA